jgi:hypothetical protein
LNWGLESELPEIKNFTNFLEARKFEIESPKTKALILEV